MSNVNWVLLFALVVPAAAQEKPQVPFDEILGCAKALDCKNMKKTSVNWYDVVSIPVIEFSDAGSTFALAVSRGALNVWIAGPGEKRPTRLVVLGPEGRLRSAELGPQPGDSSPRQMTPEERTKYRQVHKAYSTGETVPQAGAYGEEFKASWEQEARDALAAIRRQISK